MYAKQSGSNFSSYGMFRKTRSEAFEAVRFVLVFGVVGMAKKTQEKPVGALINDLA